MNRRDQNTTLYPSASRDQDIHRDQDQNVNLNNATITLVNNQIRESGMKLSISYVDNDVVFEIFLANSNFRLFLPLTPDENVELYRFNGETYVLVNDVSIKKINHIKVVYAEFLKNLILDVTSDSVKSVLVNRSVINPLMVVLLDLCKYPRNSQRGGKKDASLFHQTKAPKASPKPRVKAPPKPSPKSKPKASAIKK